nr:putative ribonuclease H-like domain-containing protein [Tanacetum cinerariifolium]
MKMKHYLSNTDYPIWQVIQNDNGPIFVTTYTNGMIKVLPPKTAEEVMARERERKARTTLLMALPEDHLEKFHKMADAKEMFQALLSQLEIHGAGVSHEDANQKFLRSLPSFWSQVALIMRTKPGLDTLSFDDLYNNLRVFKHDVKGTTVSSSSNTQNVAFVSTDNTSSTNDVSTAYSVSSPSVLKSYKKGSTSYTDEVIHSFFSNQSSAPQLDYDDLEHINDDDMEEIDLKWQVAIISIRIKKFHKRTGKKLQFDTKDPVGFDKTKVKCFNCHKIGHFARDCRAKGNHDNRRRDVRYNGNKARDNGRRLAYQDDSKALVTINEEDIDWSGHVEEDTQNYAMMAYSSSNSSSDNEVKSFSKTCAESYARLKKLYDEQRDKLGDSSVEITAYTLALKRDYRYGSILSYENEVLHSVFMNKASDLEDTSVNDIYADGMHVVPSPITGNYMPTGPDVEIDYSKYTYGLKQTLVDESNSKPSEYASCEPDSMWSDAHIIEEYESDSDDDSVSNVQEDIENPSFAFINSVKHVKSSRENIKETGTPNHSPKVEKQGRNGHTRKGLGYAFTRNACFVYSSFSHLIRDCDFHEKIAKQAALTKRKNKDDPHKALKDKGIVVSGCFRYMTGNKAQLADYQEFKSGSIAFGESNGRITGKGKIKAGRLDFEDVYYVEELKHNNLFSMSQMCDKKNKVLFSDTDYLVLSLDFKLPDENQVLLKIPRQHNMYSFNLKNIDPSRDLAILFAKAFINESNKWHRRLGHINFKNLNKLVKGNLVRGLPSKIFENDHTCVACQKRKQHKASCKAKIVSSVNQPLQILYMDLVGPTSVRSINHKTYCVVITDGFSRFSWVYFLKSKDETTPILKDFIRQAENQFNHKVKTIRSNNRVEFKNHELIEFCRLKGIKREYSNARTPQQNEVAERKNRTLIEAARTIVLVTKPQIKTPYELLTRKGYAWMFDLDYQTNSMNYEPVLVENQANKSAGPKEANHSAGSQANDAQSANSEEIDLYEEHFVLPIWSAYSTTVKSSRDKIEKTTDAKPYEKPVSQVEQIFAEELENTPISTAGPSRALNDGKPSYPDDPLMPHLENIYASPSEGIFTDSSYGDK